MTRFYALDTVDHDGRRYGRGDELPELAPAAAQALLDAGVASAVRPPAPVALRPLLEAARAARNPRAEPRSPTVADWLAWCDDLRLARGAEPLTEADCARATEQWDRFSEIDRLNALDGIETHILDIRRRAELAQRETHHPLSYA